MVHEDTDSSGCANDLQRPQRYRYPSECYPAIQHQMGWSEKGIASTIRMPGVIPVGTNKCDRAADQHEERTQPDTSLVHSSHPCVIPLILLGA